MFSNIRQLNFHRRQTSGVALVVTLTMLAIVALLAIAFVMTARTELKSGSAYSDQVAAKGLAKMAVDRAIMEIVRQNASFILSGGEVLTSNLGNCTNPATIANYTINDFTCIDNYTNDIVNPLFGVNCNGGTNSFDFVERDGVLGRSVIEPYWISVRNAQGILVGRFAYVGMGNAVDINAIGNIAGAGDTYQRPADSKFGYGYIGVLSTNALGATNYTRGICADVSLQKFLAKLGYATPAASATRILQFRYGCPASSLPASAGTYLPGNTPPSDSNNDGVNNNPSEYMVTPNLVGINQAIGSLSQLDALPNPIAPDPANTNLANYAFTGPSADSNTTNPYVGTRWNLNAMTNGTAGILSSNVANLAAILANFPQFTTTQRVQIAVNLIDFHTTNRYPSVFTNVVGTATNLVIGVKVTPYLNQVLISNMVIMTSKLISNSPTAKIMTGLYVSVSTAVIGEIWQPYTAAFPDLCQLIITNVTLCSSGAIGAAPPVMNLAITNQCTNSFAGPIPNGFVTSTNILYLAGVTNCTWLSNVNVALPAVSLTQTVNTIRFSGISSAGTTNLVNQIINVPFSCTTNFAWGALPLPPTNGLLFTQIIRTNYWFLNLEADDPRMNLLYTNNATGNYNLGAMNVVCFPNGPNTVTNYPDTGNREGTASFYVQPNGYVTVGDIGYVHRGEPWTTIRLQPYSNFVSAVSYPYGDGKLMDYFRVNELIDVAGRININSDTNGPLGAYQSPSLFALFSGITNSWYVNSPYANPTPPGAGTVIDGYTDDKITAIIKEMSVYRAGLTSGNMLYIGQMCAITNLTTYTDAGGIVRPIPYTDDANREAIIRAISNLITAWKGGGTTQIIGLGQVVKGGGTGISNGVPGAVVAIQATFKNVGGRVKLTSYQYILQ